MDTPLPFPQQLKHQRRLKGWSQAVLAEKVGSDPQTVRRWENGKTTPHPYHQEKLFELFNMDAAAFGLINSHDGHEDKHEATPSSPQEGQEEHEAPDPVQSDGNEETKDGDSTGGNGKTAPALGTPFTSYNLHSHWVLAVAWEPGGNRIASAGGDGTVHIWHADTGQPIRMYRGHEYRDIRAKTRWLPCVYNLAWSPNGQYIASSGGGKTVRVWDAETGYTRHVYRGHACWWADVFALAWSPDSSCIASACSGVSMDKTIHIWNVETERLVSRYDTRLGPYPDFSVLALAWSPDGTRIASTYHNNSIHIWEAATGRYLATYKPLNWPVDLAWSPDSRFLAIANSDARAQIWDTSNDTLILTYGGHTESVRAVAWSPNGKRIASASNDKTVHIWDPFSGDLLYMYEGHTHWTTSVAWSPDGTRIASASNDKSVQIWQAT